MQEIGEKAAQYVERGWTQYAAARTSSGESVAPYHSRAVSWCAVGAVQLAFGDGPTSEWGPGYLQYSAYGTYCAVMDALASEIVGGSAIPPACTPRMVVQRWNDGGGTKNELIRMLRSIR